MESATTTTIITVMQCLCQTIMSVFTENCTHIFEGQNNGRDDASYKDHDAEDTEEALTLGEVDLYRKKPPTGTLIRDHTHEYNMSV